MELSHLIGQLQAIQASQGPEVLVLRELPEPRGWQAVSTVVHGHMWLKHDGDS